jgi:hypothetical protein
MLRDRFGQQPPYLWTADVDVARESHLPLSYLEEETILGDVLREIRKLREEPPGALALAAYVTEAQRSGGLFHRLMQLAPERHEALLDETSDQCVALLSGKPA